MTERNLIAQWQTASGNLIRAYWGYDNQYEDWVGWVALGNTALHSETFNNHHAAKRHALTQFNAIQDVQS